jgi:hypothetical protein
MSNEVQGAMIDQDEHPHHPGGFGQPDNFHSLMKYRNEYLNNKLSS